MTVRACDRVCMRDVTSVSVTCSFTFGAKAKDHKHWASYAPPFKDLSK